jgi:uncharacterized repeat protein (TIGR04076 family)
LWAWCALEIAHYLVRVPGLRAGRLIRQWEDASVSEESNPSPSSGAAPDMQLHNLRIVVESIEGRSVCGMRVGDFCEVTNSSELRIPEGKHFCMYALASALPLLPAKQRDLPTGDWLERDTRVACPDPDERVILRIDRIGTVDLRSSDLT